MEQTKTNQADGMKIGTMLTFCVANIGMVVMDTVLDSFVQQYYAPEQSHAAGAAKAVQYAPIALVGLAIMFGRLMDAAANPIVGYLSDKTKTRWGRRIPYLLFGCIPMTLFFILMFTPPIPKENPWNVVWLGATCGCFLFLYTFVVAPYLALIPELARSSDDRVKLSSWHTGATVLGLFIGGGVAGFVLIPMLDTRGMGVVMGLFSLATILYTALIIKEPPLEEKKRTHESFIGAIKPPLKNKHFLIYAFSICAFWLGYKILQNSMIYVVTNILGKDKGYVGYVNAGLLLVLLISTPFVFWLYGRFGKKKLFLTGLFLMMALTPLQAFILKAGAFMNPTIYYHIIIAITGFPIALMMVIYNAVISDIIDYDEKVTGSRREAMYYGMEGLFTKVARGLGASISSFLFAIFGVQAGKAYGLLWAGPVCAVFALVGVLIFMRYKLTD